MCNKFSYINTAVLVVVSWEIGRSGCTTTSDIPIIMLNFVYLSIQPLHANVYKKCPTNYHTAAVFVVVSYWLVDTAAAVLVCRHMGVPVYHQLLLYCSIPFYPSLPSYTHIIICCSRSAKNLAGNASHAHDRARQHHPHIIYKKFRIILGVYLQPYICILKQHHETAASWLEEKQPWTVT